MLYRSSVSFKQPVVKKQSAGFSIIELIVSISILILVLSIVFTQQGAFNSAVLLRSQTYDIALAMRELQLGAVSATSDGSGNYRSVQGFYVNTGAIGKDRYRVFKDADGDFFYDTNEDFGFSGLLDPRFEIRGLSPSTIGSGLSIVFERPNFDANFYTSAGTRLDIPAVLITIGLRDGVGTACGADIREIEITSSGQIAVLECP